MRVILPQGSFDDTQDHIHSSSPHPLRHSSPSTSPYSESRLALFTDFYLLFRCSHASVREVTVHNRPSSFTPLRWTRALFSGPQRPDIEWEQRPSEVEVPYTRGLARNAKVGQQSEKKAPIPNNIMTISVTGTPIQVQQSSSQPQVLLTAAPAIVTSTTQQSSQPQALLSATMHAAATAPVTGTVLHPDIVIRQPRLWTRFQLFLYCVSAQIADNHNQRTIFARTSLFLWHSCLVKSKYTNRGTNDIYQQMFTSGCESMEVIQM
ncbi:hypothetical protein AZE42_08218 [Rhizopogon vesiculosus]|uniref:Uncharacterized protein n=1 Tax=Rhizopogon vesiculosus TaxID=180088 RepID=A0A1J8QJF9_9AGAM|nr:hypothetical protein AZE42_08218 [Rhizopogon vesiculosus]